ncbi:hypothetical protein MTO96_027893 [Rhipicephalus appendiculatus]
MKRLQEYAYAQGSIAEMIQTQPQPEEVNISEPDLVQQDQDPVKSVPPVVDQPMQFNASVGSEVPQLFDSAKAEIPESQQVLEAAKPKHVIASGPLDVAISETLVVKQALEVAINEPPVVQQDQIAAIPEAYCSATRSGSRHIWASCTDRGRREIQPSSAFTAPACVQLHGNLGAETNSLRYSPPTMQDCDPQLQ